ncbi:MAG: DUF177 domain-containing protein [Pseudomonadota bacterium]|nr:DUF177 domain-containing protein [Pseudomonadota bacterium]
MSSRAFDPNRLDVAAFALEAGELAGRWPLRSFDRVSDSAAAESPPGDADEVVWSARGERRPMRGGEHQTWLHLHADAAVALQCQRCLAPVQVPVSVQRSFLFVHGEDAAAQVDAASEDDVLALTRALDLRELIEDELLLALPLVPLHGVCPEPLPVAVDDEAEERANPFAALGSLKALKGDPPVN